MNPLAWATSSIRRRGFFQTSRILASNAQDFFFDWRYGTETFRLINVQDLEIDLESKQHAGIYQATKARVFERLMHRLELPRECGFVDIGSGKGRVLLLAAQYGFSRVVGVEFSRQLCEQARRNIEKFSKVVPLRSPVEVQEADATTFEIPADLCVFYLYNPFDASILSRFLDNLAHSLAASPRRTWLIYNNPKYDEVVQQSGLYPNRQFHEIGGTEFAVHLS